MDNNQISEKPFLSISKKCFSKNQWTNLSQVSEENLAFNLWLGTMLVKTYGDYDYSTLMHAFRMENQPISNRSDEPNELNEKSNVSADLGSTGEKYVEKVIGNKYLVQNTAKKGRKGDMIALRNEEDIFKVLVEVKNYTSTVNSEQVEKFYRDIEANQSLKGAVFVSLNTNIVGINGSFVFKELYKGRNIPVVFVCSRKDEIILAALEVVWAYADHKDLISQKSFSKMGKRISELSDVIDGLSEARNHISETRVMIEKQLTRVYDSVMGSELKLEQAINSLRETVSKEYGEFHSLGGDDSDKFKLLADKFPDTIYSTDESFKKITDDIIREYLKKHNTENIKAVCGDKNVTFVEVIKRDKKSKKDLCKELLILKFLKTRIDISVLIKIEDSDNIRIPTFGAYSNGWVTFEIDKKYNKSGIVEKIHHWLEKI